MWHVLGGFGRQPNGSGQGPVGSKGGALAVFEAEPHKRVSGILSLNYYSREQRDSSTIQNIISNLVVSNDQKCVQHVYFDLHKVVQGAIENRIQMYLTIGHKMTTILSSALSSLHHPNYILE